MSDLKSELIESFEFINVKIEGAILEKCLELCKCYKKDADELCEEWCAFTASYLNGAPPTVNDLLKLERKVFMAIKSKEIAKVSAPMVDVDDSNIDEDTVNALPREIGQISEFSQKFSQRIESGTVLFSYGVNVNKIKPSDRTTPITLMKSMVSPLRYMDCKSYMTAEAINTITNWLGAQVIAERDIDISEDTLKSQFGNMIVLGRIMADSTIGKLNSESVLFESTLEKNGAVVQLNLSKMNHFALYNGQIVLVSGTNDQRAKRFYVNEILNADWPTVPIHPVDTSNPSKPHNEQISIVVAAGPFSFNDSLNFEPLDALITQIMKIKPHIFILIGPLIAYTNSQLKQMESTFDKLFQRILCVKICEPLESINVKVLVVPSYEDMNGHMVYPTPPLNVHSKITEQYNVISAPNPCQFETIGDLRVGVQSTDVLFHLSKMEYFQDKSHTNGPTDRMGRLAGHLINQCSFYPIYPADRDVPIDYTLLQDFGLMDHDRRPHLLILPSRLRYFAKIVKNCFVVNPEHLCKMGMAAGTFAHIQLAEGTAPLAHRIRCSIIRI